MYLTELFKLYTHIHRCHTVGYLSNVKLFLAVNFLKPYECLPPNWPQPPARAAWKTRISIFINILEASAFVMNCCSWNKKHTGVKTSPEQNLSLLGERRKTSPSIAMYFEGQTAQLCHWGIIRFRPLLCLLWEPGWLLWSLGCQISLLCTLIDFKSLIHYRNQCQAKQTDFVEVVISRSIEIPPQPQQLVVVHNRTTESMNTTFVHVKQEKLYPMQ